MKCYRKNGSDVEHGDEEAQRVLPSMKCYRKNGSDTTSGRSNRPSSSLNEVLPKER